MSFTAKDRNLLGECLQLLEIHLTCHNECDRKIDQDWKEQDKWLSTLRKRILKAMEVKV